MLSNAWRLLLDWWVGRQNLTTVEQRRHCAARWAREGL